MVEIIVERPSDTLGGGTAIKQEIDETLRVGPRLRRIEGQAERHVARGVEAPALSVEARVLHLEPAEPVLRHHPGFLESPPLG